MASSVPPRSALVAAGTKFSAAEDVEFLEKQFEEESLRLFKTDGSNEFEILYARENEEPLQIKLDDYDHIDAEISRFDDSGSIRMPRFYIIRQENSYGRLLIASNLFRNIVSRYEIFPSYLDFVRAFGYKMSDEEHLRHGYQWQISKDLKLIQLCYNVRFFEKNAIDKWSLRQMGVYHQYVVDKKKSLWILLQPSHHVNQRIKEFLSFKVGELEDPQDSQGDILELHVTILVVLARHWRAYIEHVQSQVNKLDEKACFSRVGKAAKFDYSVTFEDRQFLHQTRGLLLKARTALESNIDIAAGCETRYQYLFEIGLIDLSQTCQSDLKIHIVDLKFHMQTLNAMLERTGWLSDMLQNILEYRYDELIKLNSSALRDLASNSNMETQNIVRLTNEAAADSKSLHSLTNLATLFLPATLLATIFSSNLIQYKTEDQGSSKGHFTLVSDFWVFALVALFATILMLLYILWLPRKPRFF